MDATNMMANPPAANEKAFAKPVVNNADKGLPKNSGAGAEKQEKDFSNVLEEVVKQAEVVDEPKTEDVVSVLSLITAVTPVAIVDVGSALQTMVITDANESLPDMGVTTKVQGDLTFQAASKPTAFVGELESLLAESATPSAERVMPQPVVSAESKSTSQALLNMLSGKTTPTALQVNANVVGVQTNVVGVQTNVVGVQTNVVGVQTSVVGVQANVVGVQANVVGVQANAVGVQANAVGVQANAVGVQANAVGVQANAVGVQANVVGVQANAVGAQANVVGAQANVVGVQANAVGAQANVVGAQANAIGVQANVNNAQFQSEKPQQAAMVWQHDAEGETTVFPVTKSAAMQGNQADLSQENSFSSDKEGRGFFQNLVPEVASDDVKQPKVTVADLLKQNNIEMQSKDITETSTFVKPEVLTDGPEQVKANIPQFITNVVDMRTAPNQPIVQNAVAETPETMAKYNIPDQIIEQARLIKTTEDTQMVIKLRPEHLGELTLKVTVEHGVVSASFHSDNANVRSMIESSLLQLRQELTAQGIKVDNVGVYAGLGQFFSNGQSQTNGQQQSSKFKNQKIDLADFEDEVEKTSGEKMGNNAVSDGVDYRI